MENNNKNIQVEIPEEVMMEALYTGCLSSLIPVEKMLQGKK